MDWSGDGRWTGTHAARQAEPGHGTVVLTAVQGSGTCAAVQGANRRGALLGHMAGRLWRLEGGGGGGGGGSLGFWNCDR